MRCTDPRTVGFMADGKTICWSQKHRSKEYATFQLPCGQCIECRLDYARQWAVRCVHEAQMYTKNCFITLTYRPEALTSPKLQYDDFQKFVKKLRKRPYFKPDGTWVSKSEDPEPMGFFVTGEYGEKTKRPHWHAIIFNWEPSDGLYHYTNDNGDRVHTSAQLSKLWGHGNAEYGTVTFKSAGYCARYAAKKLVHGSDEEHDYQPISKKSSKHAIGKKWLEQYWHTDCFAQGRIILPDGNTTGVPRYYEKWLKQNRPSDWLAYVTKTKLEKMESAQARSDQEHSEWKISVTARLAVDPFRTFPKTGNQIRNEIQKEKFKQLQNYLKL
jgi:hypothetical protein